MTLFLKMQQTAGRAEGCVMGEMVANELRRGLNMIAVIDLHQLKHRCVHTKQVEKEKMGK